MSKRPLKIWGRLALVGGVEVCTTITRRPLFYFTARKRPYSLSEIQTSPVRWTISNRASLTTRKYILGFRIYLELWKCIIGKYF
jgi:hypothetical protein